MDCIRELCSDFKLIQDQFILFKAYPLLFVLNWNELNFPNKFFFQIQIFDTIVICIFFVKVSHYSQIYVLSNYNFLSKQ